jgi:hypothetical protein
MCARSKRAPPRARWQEHPGLDPAEPARGRPDRHIGHTTWLGPRRRPGRLTPPIVPATPAFFCFDWMTREPSLTSRQIAAVPGSLGLAPAPTVRPPRGVSATRGQPRPVRRSRRFHSPWRAFGAVVRARLVGVDQLGRDRPAVTRPETGATDRWQGGLIARFALWPAPGRTSGQSSGVRCDGGCGAGGMLALRWKLLSGS